MSFEYEERSPPHLASASVGTESGQGVRERGQGCAHPPSVPMARARARVKPLWGPSGRFAACPDNPNDAGAWPIPGLHHTQQSSTLTDMEPGRGGLPNPQFER